MVRINSIDDRSLERLHSELQRLQHEVRNLKAAVAVASNKPAIETQAVEIVQVNGDIAHAAWGEGIIYYPQPDGNYRRSPREVPLYNYTSRELDHNQAVPAFRDKFGRYVAIAHHGHQSEIVGFALRADLATTDASQTVEVIWRGVGGNPGTAANPSLLTVYNPPTTDGGSTYRFTGDNGATGEAVWDNTNSKFWIIQLTCG